MGKIDAKFIESVYFITFLKDPEENEQVIADLKEHLQIIRDKITSRTVEIQDYEELKKTKKKERAQKRKMQPAPNPRKKRRVSWGTVTVIQLVTIC